MPIQAVNKKSASVFCTVTKALEAYAFTSESERILVWYEMPGTPHTCSGQELGPKNRSSERKDWTCATGLPSRSRAARPCSPGSQNPATRWSAIVWACAFSHPTAVAQHVNVFHAHVLYTYNISTQVQGSMVHAIMHHFKWLQYN